MRVAVALERTAGPSRVERLLPTVRELAQSAGAELHERAIETEAHAEQARFLGSPSVRIDGVDVEPGAQERTDFGLKCRLYRSVDGQSGLPPRRWIENALCETRRGVTALGCCREEEPARRLNDRQCSARALVGVASFGLAALTARRTGVVRAAAAVAAGWFGASHPVAARTRYPGCPELGAIPSAMLGRDVPVGCAPWAFADRRPGLVA